MAAFVASQRDGHRVPATVACRALGVSRSWYYKWASGRLPPRAARQLRLAAEVKRLFELHHASYGAPRITADLRAAGWRVSQNTVAAVMRHNGLDTVWAGMGGRGLSHLQEQTPHPVRSLPSSRQDRGPAGS